MVSAVEHQGHARFIDPASLPVQQLQPLVDVRLLRLPFGNHEQDMRGVVGKRNSFTTREN